MHRLLGGCWFLPAGFISPFPFGKAALRSTNLWLLFPGGREIKQLRGEARSDPRCIILKEAKGGVPAPLPPRQGEGVLLPLPVLAHAAIPTRHHLWVSHSSQAQLRQASPFSSAAAAWSVSLGAFWKSVNPLRAKGCPRRSKDPRGIGAGAAEGAEQARPSGVKEGNGVAGERAAR